MASVWERREQVRKEENKPSRFTAKTPVLCRKVESLRVSEAEVASRLVACTRMGAVGA